MQMLQDQSWAAMAACATDTPDDLFVQGAAQRSARVICFGCQVRLQCLADALDNRVPFGVWGGMTERERRALLRRQPDVESWRTLLSSGDEAVAELVAVKPPRGGRTTAAGRPTRLSRAAAERAAARRAAAQSPGAGDRN